MNNNERKTTQCLYVGGLVDASADIIPEIKRRVRLAWACYSRFKRKLYHMEAASFALKLRMQKAEVMETLLYGCVTWTLGSSTSLSCKRHIPGSPADHWLPAPTTHRSSHVVRQGPYEGTIRERRDDHPHAAYLLYGGRTADAQ